MTTLHYTIGGSTMARTLACPSWVSLSKDIPKSPGSAFADDGTLKHSAMELLYNDLDLTPETLVGSLSYNDIVLTEEMLDTAIYPAINAVEDLLETHYVKTLVTEPFVEFIKGVAGGSIDMLAKSGDGDTVLVIDYKFGHNTVRAKENPQMLFYALCAMADPATSDKFFNNNGKLPKRLVLAIIQPNDDGPVADVWETDLSVLDDFGKKVNDAVIKVENISNGVITPEYVTGTHCKYCPAAAVCPKKTGAAQKALRLKPTDVAILAEALPLIPEIESWISAVTKLAHEQLEAGVKIPGYKLVNKRASRVWSSEDDIAEVLKKMRRVKHEEVHNYKLKSPAQMEKLFKEKGIDPALLSEYISSVVSGTTIAPESDKRPDAAPQAAIQALVDRLS